MKPHEEVGWHDDDEWVFGDEGGDVIVELPFRHPESNDPYEQKAYTNLTAKLIAAAPEMARMLLDLMWSGCRPNGPGDSCDPGCIECNGEKPWSQQVPARRVDAFTRIDAHVAHHGGHKPDCKLVALLRKAGVLSESEEQKK